MIFKKNEAGPALKACLPDRQAQDVRVKHNKNWAFAVLFIASILFFGLLSGKQAKATDYEYLHIKIDSVWTIIDGTQLWQFHGFNGQPHNVSGDGELNILGAPAGFQCGIWVVEEDAVLRDMVGALWTKAGNKLQKGGTSISADLIDKAWNIGDGTGVPATDICSFINIDTGSLICDFESSSSLASTIGFGYGPVDGVASEDMALSNIAANTYRPDTDILCAGPNNWKTCDISSCVTIGANSWACDGATNVWSNCTTLGGTCSAGACLIVTATPTLTLTPTVTPTPTGVACPTLAPAEGCFSPGARGENRYDPLTGGCKIFPVPCQLAYFCENGVCKEPRPVFSMLTDGASFLASLLIGLALLFLVFGAIRYILAGVTLDAEIAKKIIFYAIFGLIIGGASYSIIGVIYNVLNPNPPPIIISGPNVNPLSGPIGTVFTIKANITAIAGVNNATAIAHIQKPDEADITTVTLYDDGTHSDGAAGDGLYGNVWMSAALGPYFVDINACDVKGNCTEANNI